MMRQIIMERFKNILYFSYIDGVTVILFTVMKECFKCIENPIFIVVQRLVKR